jgi:lysophospholipase L1-like esterase
MKNKISNKIILISVASLVVVGISTALIYRFVKNKKGKSKIKNKNPKKILIIGDSQSAIESPNGTKISYTYPNLLQSKLKDKGVTIDVIAQVGKTTDWMKKNLPAKLKTKKYDRVIIYGGGNDASNSSTKLENVVKNIQEMVDMSIENGADAFVNLGYKVQGDFGNYKIMPLTPYIKEREKWIPLVERRKELQKLISQKIKNATIIPTYDLQSKTTDGIHPTSSGHKIVADKIYDSIVKQY